MNHETISIIVEDLGYPLYHLKKIFALDGEKICIEVDGIILIDKS